MRIVVDDVDLVAPEGLHVTTFKDPGITRFVNKTREPKRVTEVIVHETVTRSWPSTVDVLKQRGLGVHFIVGPEGNVYQHADLLRDLMWHASQHNGCSVGIEVVNPYEPRLMPQGGPWHETIEASWAAGGRYVLPPPAQAEAVCTLVNWLSSAVSGLTIPQQWPGLQHTHSLSMGRVPADVGLNPGIHAHTYFGHADGAWLVLYCWLRMEARLAPEVAYRQAVVRATGPHTSSVSLADLFAKDPFLES